MIWFANKMSAWYTLKSFHPYFLTLTFVPVTGNDMKSVKKIIILIIIQVLLFTQNGLAFDVNKSFDFDTFSPPLNLPLDSFKTVCLNFNINGLDIDSEQIDDYADKFIFEVQRRMKFINKAVLRKFRFDTNAEFYRRYRSDRDKKIEVKVIKELQDDYSYELEVICEGKSYKITGYIIGAIAADEHLNLSAKESQMLIKGHFATMTKITLPSNGNKVFVHEPGWAVVEGINYDEKIKAKA